MDINDIKKREQDFDALWSRMEKDRNSITDATYSVLDYKEVGGGVVPKMYHVNLKLQGKDYSKYISKLLALKMKYQVLTEDSSFNKGKLLNFLYDSDYIVNKRLSGVAKTSYRARHSAFACHAGWFAEQNTWRVVDGILIPDTRTIWARYLSWDTDTEGFAWACPLYFRTAADVNAEYPQANASGDKLIEVRDYWNKDVNQVYVNDELVSEEENPYGYVPFVILPAPWGPIFDGDNSLEHLGESIFYPHRDLYDEANFNASVAKTEAREGLRPPLQTAGKGPDGQPGSGDIVENQEQPLTVVPRADMTNAQRVYSGLISSTLQQNSFAVTDSGTTTAPMSGTAIESLNVGGEEVLTSRKSLLQEGFARSAQMRVDQFIQIGESLPLGKRGHVYKPDDLTGEYDIECFMFDGSPEGYARRGQAAGTLIGHMPEDWIRPNIIMADDPDDVDDQVDAERAEQTDPADGMYDRIRGKIKRGFSTNDNSLKVSAWMDLQTLLLVLKQRMGVGVPEPMTNRPPEKRPMPATMGNPSVNIRSNNG